MEWLSRVSDFSIFLAIAAVGLMFLLLPLIFGEIFDRIGESGLTHDIDHGGPSIFGARILSVFMTTFGSFGAIGVQFRLGLAPASALGLASRAVCASLTYGFARFLRARQAGTEVRKADVLVRAAPWRQVSTKMPEERPFPVLVYFGSGTGDHRSKVFPSGSRPVIYFQVFPVCVSMRKTVCSCPVRPFLSQTVYGEETNTYRPSGLSVCPP
ncbi:MAG: hypothetical protein AAB225_05155 [Acidobacteriota bacterium]